jgi:DNA N-6-adenine-methyltransferase (Dam)
MTAYSHRDHDALVEASQGGEIIAFKPERHQLTVAALDFGIKQATRIRDWPALEEAVDLKIEEQRRFVVWWGAMVRRPGGDRQAKHSPGSRGMPCSEAEALTGMRNQRVSELARKLAQPDQYRRHLLGAAYRAAMLDDEHDHHDGDEWGTPVEIIEPVRAFYGGQIDCDPATNLVAQRIVRATIYYTKEQDGLRQPWPGKTLLNGPYSNLAPWVNKLISEYEAGRATEVVTLTNGALGTEWFNVLLGAAARACILRDRQRFLLNGEARNSPITGQVLFYFGPRFSDFTRAFRPLGRVVRMAE